MSAKKPAIVTQEKKLEPFHEVWKEVIKECIKKYNDGHAEEIAMVLKIFLGVIQDTHIPEKEIPAIIDICEMLDTFGREVNQLDLMDANLRALENLRARCPKQKIPKP